MRLVLVVVGIVLIIISAFWTPPRVSFWNLGWGLVLAGVLLFGGAQLQVT